jgi:hypothetical protein
MESRSPITNCWGKVRPKKIDVDHRIVSFGTHGSSFNHQAQLTSLDGVLYASWTKGIKDEESPAETMAFSISEDKGKTWSPARSVAGPEPGRFADRVIVSSGIRAYEGTLIAYYGDWEYGREALDENGCLKGIEVDDSAFWTNLSRATTEGRAYSNCRHHINCVTRAKTSSDGGKTWSPPIDIIPRIATYHSPELTASRRLILPGHATFPYTDDPWGLQGWKFAGLAGLSASFVDSVMGWFFGREKRKDPVIYSEGSFYQTQDRVIHMMLRTETNWLAVSESIDDGVTWAEPVLTEYTDNICRPHFGRLPDGRHFGMTCPSPEGRRTPAVLAISSDGVVFDRHYILGDDVWRPMRIPGFAKGGRYGYPWLHVDHENGYMIYSIEKEDIGVGRFRLEDLK